MGRSVSLLFLPGTLDPGRDVGRVGEGGKFASRRGGFAARAWFPTRVIASCALSKPQCDATMSNSGGSGCGTGQSDHGDVVLCLLITAYAVVSMRVCQLIIPSAGLSGTAVAPRAVLSGGAPWRGKPECRYVIRINRYSVFVVPRWYSRS